MGGTHVSSVTEPFVAVQYNVENGGLSNPVPGQTWERSRLDGFIDFMRHQRAEHGMKALLQQEGCFYQDDGYALLHEVEAATRMRAFLAPGVRARSAGKKDHPAVVWVDPEVTILRRHAHSGGTWWHSAMQVQVLLAGHTVNLVSTHFNVASPVLRAGESAALTMIGELMVIAVDANSARATGPAQSMTMSDRKHHAHRAASPDRPDEPDRAAARYAEFAGLVEVHTHVGTPEALRFTTGHRPKHAERQGGGSHADHDYVSAALADGTVARVSDCLVITGREYPGVEEISDHLPTRFALEFTRV
jgi:hypothetical protein